MKKFILFAPPTAIIFLMVYLILAYGFMDEFVYWSIGIALMYIAAVLLTLNKRIGAVFGEIVGVPLIVLGLIEDPIVTNAVVCGIIIIAFYSVMALVTSKKT